MKIGPKYKIARRLKAPIFEKTQNAKYALREERKSKSKGRGKGFSRPKTDFGMQLNEKQKAKMFYAVAERQFAKYVKAALADKSGSPADNLLKTLEHRLDNAVWRAGLLPTHLAARQAVAHGHFIVNGKKTYVPSYSLKEGDTITIREGSRASKLWSHLDEPEREIAVPEWLSWDSKKKELTVKKASSAQKGDLLFDLGQVIEYYQR